MRVLVDADPVVYAAGFVSEDIYYEGVAWNDDGQDVQFRVRSGAEFADLRLRYKYIEKARVAVGHPTSEALLATNSIVNSIRARVAEHAGVIEHAVRISPFLSGKSNYREQIAKQRPYKGNRDRLARPIHYQRIRDHLERKLGAKVIDGREADDEVSIQGWAGYRNNEPYVIATIDKDLDQIPGLHYDYKKHVFYEVNEAEARRAFWIQVLCGDVGDNVPGCWKVGPAKAEDLVDDLLPLNDYTIWEAVVRIYEASTEHPLCPYKRADAPYIALETAQLVYLQKVAGELWMPPGDKFGTVKGDSDD